MKLFTESNLSPELLKAIGELGYVEPTEVQQQTIPFIQGNVQDLIALAATGTGKTAAFSLPILDMIDVDSRKIQFLILCPTRELCIQITKDIKSYSKYLPDVKSVAVYGGSSITDQMRSLREKPQIIVGTPGRVIDLINRNALNFNDIQWLVFDEADEMLNFGFKDDLETILKETPQEKQTLLFSATMSKEIERITKNYLSDAHRITIKSTVDTKKNISQEYYVVQGRHKRSALKRLIDFNPNQYSIIFCRTRMETQDVADFLMQNGYAADALHGDLSQAQRDTVMKKFRLKNINILVATDVAARGLDVDSLTHVIHFSLPDDPEVFTHRSGRTGRAGKTGIAISIIKPEEGRKLKQIKASCKLDMTEKQIPTGNDILKAQVSGVFEKLFTQHDNVFEFDATMIPDLSAFTKEELAHKLLQFQLREMALYYDENRDLQSHTMEDRGDFSRDRGGRDRGGRDRFERGGSRDGGSRDRFERGSSRDGARDRDGGRDKKPKRNSDMDRYFFNLGKKDQLKKIDVFEIINNCTKKSGKKADVGDIEILDKFSFFEVEKSFRDDIMRGIHNKDYKGREMRIEIAK